MDSDIKPQIINDRLMVQFRKIGEDPGATVTWDNDTRKVSIILYMKYIDVFVSNTFLTCADLKVDDNGNVSIDTKTRRMITLDLTPVIVNDYILVHLRAISEGLGVYIN